MTAPAPAPELKLLSSISGRQRWFAPVLLDRPRLAAAVEQAIRREAPAIAVKANPTNGRLLLEWQGEAPARTRDLIGRALSAKPITQAALVALRGAPDNRAQNLVGKLVIGGLKLSLVFVNRLIFGAFTGGPLGAPIAILSVSGAIITGFSFLRALFRTVTGQSPITTGTLIGTATLSSILLRESVTALVVIWLLNMGEYLETVTLRRTRAAIRDLLSADDGELWVLINGVEVAMQASAAVPGQIAVVRSGQRIPVDGIVAGGDATVNEAAITGESMPALRTTGDRVFAGTVLLAGMLRIRITQIGAETAVGKLIERVEMAQSLRPNIQTVGDAFARKVVPASLFSAALVLLVTRDPHRALTMLLVACPCAAGLATPTAASASIGNSARRGILIKGGRHLESMSEVDTIGFDKTGTLTGSEPVVQRIVSLSDGYTEERVLYLAARAEIHSRHPLALAIVKSAGATEASGDYELLAGRGVRCTWDGHEVLVGSRSLLDEFGIDAIHADPPAPESNESVMYIAHQGRLVGMIGVAAAIRPGAARAIQRLRDVGITRVLMLTGDSQSVAEYVANSVGVTEWRARLLPDDKFDAIRELRSAGRKVAMVGDGVNDAPALALANVGIAMGTAGSDVAIETADVALAGDNLDHVADVLQISRQMMSVVRQNYGLSLGVNSLGLVLAAAGRLNPIMAAVLHNLSTILVVFNSSRLIHYVPGGSDGVALPLRSGRRSIVPVTQEEEHGCCGDCSTGRAASGK
jgi:cation-transporting P-type ATPase C